MDDTRKHLIALFGEHNERLPEGCYPVLAGIHADKKVTDGKLIPLFSRDWHQCAEHAAAWQNDREVYISMALRPHNAYPAGGLGTNKDARAVFGLHADIDAGTLGHAKPGYPPTIELAQELYFHALPKLYPTLTVLTGGGVHTHLLFDKVLLLDDPAVGARFDQLIVAFQERLRDFFAQKGFVLDNTSDRIRLVRLAGTYNRKVAPARFVRLLNPPGPYYSFEELCDVLPPLDRPVSITKPEVAVFLQGVVWPTDYMTLARPSKLDVLLQLDADARASAQYAERANLQDNSISGHEMSLVLKMLYKDFTPQEIIHSLYCIRQANGVAFDKDGRQYFTKTLEKALEFKGTRDTQKLGTLQGITETLDRLPDEAKEARADLTESIKAMLLDKLSLHVLAVEQRGETNPLYTLTVQKGEEEKQVTIRGTKALYTNSDFRHRLAEQAGIFLQVIKNDVWNTYAYALVRLAREAGVKDCPSPREQLAGLVSAYIGEGELTLVDDLDTFHTVVRQQSTCLYDGQVYVSAASLETHLMKGIRMDLTTSELYEYMEKDGWALARLTPATSRRGRRNTYLYWSKPYEHRADA